MSSCSKILKLPQILRLSKNFRHNYVDGKSQFLLCVCILIEVMDQIMLIKSGNFKNSFETSSHSTIGIINIEKFEFKTLIIYIQEKKFLKGLDLSMLRNWGL